LGEFLKINEFKKHIDGLDIDNFHSACGTSSGCGYDCCYMCPHAEFVSGFKGGRFGKFGFFVQCKKPVKRGGYCSMCSDFMRFVYNPYFWGK